MEELENNEKIGVGIITCNRKDSAIALAKQVLSLQQAGKVQEVVIVKNKQFDYGPEFSELGCSMICILEDVGVGYCKNAALKHLLDYRCQHLFLIEDDMKLKSPHVFQRYIETAKHFNLGHLNWNTLPQIKDTNPTYTISHNGFSLDISFRLCGCFSYFSKDALQYVGLIDDQHYVNALEHAEHAYRMSLRNFTTPFYAFADVHDAFELLTNDGEGSSTIDHSSHQYQVRTQLAAESFMKTYGKSMAGIQAPSVEHVKAFLSKKMSHEL